MGWYLCKFYLKDAIYWETGRYANEEDALWVPLKICDVTRCTLCSVPNELRVILINFLNLLFLSHFCPFLDFIRFSFSLFHSLSPKFSGKLSLSPPPRNGLHDVRRTLHSSSIDQELVSLQFQWRPERQRRLFLSQEGLSRLLWYCSISFF